MKVLDAGHKYELRHLDGSDCEVLTFVKREGPGYPGNVGHYEGTNLQEVLRALIDRVKYLDNQIPCSANRQVLLNLRLAILSLEERAARRHKRRLSEIAVNGIELQPTCQHCGHIGCDGVGCFASAEAGKAWKIEVEG